jgi:hypothetical protein
VLNAAGATQQNLSAVSDELSTSLARVIGVLNVSTLTLAPGAVGSLSQTLQTLALPDLVTATPGATAQVLNLVVASQTTQAPVDVNLLGLVVSTSDVHAKLVAQTGDGQILGNLAYNVSHLLDPGGSLALLPILTSLGI